MTTLLANDRATMISILLPVTIIGLSMSIPIVAIITEHFQKKARMRLIEKAIEHGASLDDLQLDEPAQPRLPYRGGMVTTAVGLGLLATERFVDLGTDVLGIPLAGGGFICIGVGVALLINDWMNRDRIGSAAKAP